jgi:hypothetical protein
MRDLLIAGFDDVFTSHNIITRENTREIVELF